MSGWMWSTKEFLDYDSYKSKISSIWDSIWDKVESLGDGIENLGDKIDIDVEFEDGKKDTEQNSEKVDEEKTQESVWKQIIKSFPKPVKFTEFPEVKEKSEQGNKSENIWNLTWYSKSDLLWVINKYIERNLDDDTEILVTVEYEDDSTDPQKIILQTQPISSLEEYQVSSSDSLLDDLFK